nr:hypothetical protein [Sphingobium sp. YR768]
MSYRRIWLLVDSLNHAWAEPVVQTRVGVGKRVAPAYCVRRAGARQLPQH